MLDEKRKNISLDEVKKIGLEEQMEKVVKKSEEQYKAADWFLYRLDFYDLDDDLKNPEGKEYINSIFEKYIHIFYDDFTKDFKEEYKDKIFELFKKETKKILDRNVEKMFIMRDTVLFEDMKRRMISEINFQMGVADYVCDSTLEELANKVSKDYEDRIDLVNSGSNVYLNYKKALEIYFKYYLLGNYKTLTLMEVPNSCCWYKEGWGIMTWIYKINGGGEEEEYSYPEFFPDIYDAFCNSKKKKEFFEELSNDKKIIDEQKIKYDLLFNAREKFLKGELND